MSGAIFGCPDSWEASSGWGPGMRFNIPPCIRGPPQWGCDWKTGRVEHVENTSPCHCHLPGTQEAHLQPPNQPLEDKIAEEIKADGTLCSCSSSGLHLACSGGGQEGVLRERVVTLAPLSPVLVHFLSALHCWRPGAQNPTVGSQ